MSGLGELIRKKRTARQMSLRDLGREIGVTAAYIADIESNRRLPSAELKHKISAALDIPTEELEEADNRLSSDLQDWVQQLTRVF